MRNNGTAIQWRYPAEEEWRDLVALTELWGAAGENGKDGADGKNGVDGRNGTNGKDGVNGTDGKNGIDGKDGVDGKNGADGTNGKDGADGKDGINAKNIEVQRAESYIQWRYEGDEWQNLVAIADIEGPAGQNGTDGANGKTPEFRVSENILQWRYVDDEIWLNLYDLSVLKGLDGKDGADGKDGTNGQNGTNGEDGRTPEFRVNGNQLQWRYEGETIWLNLYDLSALKGADGKDGSCAGYFAANGRVYSWGTPLQFNVKKESGDLISYNSSSKTITLSKGHTYSMVFSGTVMISANGNYKLCGASLIDGYNSSEMMLETRTYVSMIDDGQSARLGMSYNTIYSAEEDIALTFQYTNMLFQNTNFTDSQYNITIIALD